MRINKNNIIKTMACLAAGLGMAACSADLFDAPEMSSSQYSEGTQLVLNVALPRNMQEGTRTESDATDQECKVTSLKMLAFAETGSVEVRNLDISQSALAGHGEVSCELKGLQPGNYRIYVIANVPDDKLGDVRSEEHLKQVILDYSESLPQAGSLPMIYEPSAGVGIPSEASNNPAVQTLSMKFACVKVRYNLIFDKSISETAEVFGTNGLLIKDVKAERVSKSSYLVKNAKLPEGRTVSLSGNYYNDYTNTPANETVNNADVITAKGDGATKPAQPSQKWLWQGTIYLPERYATSADSQTRLVINAYIPDTSGNEGNVHCSYTLPLGGYNGNETSTELPRNTYYEVIGTIKSLGAANLDATIVTKDWMSTNLTADFVHTYLKLSKTTLKVESLEDDELTYQTDGRGTIDIVCTSKLPVSSSTGKPAVIFIADQATGKITVKANPEVSIKDLASTERKGTADCYIKAGNIEKHFKVEYDIEPFFSITPLAVKIQIDQANPQLNEKVFEYRTNLGGIILTADGNGTPGSKTQYINKDKTSATITMDGKPIKVSCDNPSSAVGLIKVKVDAADISKFDFDKNATIVYDLDAYPMIYDQMSEAFKGELKNRGMEDLTVTVMPPIKDYYVYFRAINDYHIGEGGDSNKSGEFLKGNLASFPAEGGTNNWKDFWDNYGNSVKDNEHHRIYIYTQLGETLGTGIDQPVWEFTAKYTAGADKMTADDSKAGWYYYVLPYNKKYVDRFNGASSYGDDSPYCHPFPGQTLMIFTSGHDREKGFTLHRASHHLDPGISLFDYEDREGYVVYDPTSEPYFYVFDDKPVIEDVEFTIYSDKKVVGWYKMYGNASNAVPTDAQRYTIWCNSVTSSQVTLNGKNWFKTVIKLKCPKGEYAKAINIKFDGVTTGGTPQRVFFGNYGGDLGSYGCPRVYIYKDGGGEMTSWANAPKMKFYRNNGTGKEYYYDIPAGYENARVIFRHESNDNVQYPTGDGLKLEGKSKILYSDSKDWMDSDEQPSMGTFTGEESVLFGGRKFKDNTGYFNTASKKWSQTAN